MKPTDKDISRALKRAHREVDLENKTGWANCTVIHTSKKKYTRKNKHK